ncbi:MAG: HD domain-containing protein [archaeon]|nr:HD domain-containing protein [archaeon]
MDIIDKVREYVKKQFYEHPHFSFGDWKIMYNHSLKVEKIAMKISESVECEKLLVSIGSLLHDIGKTFEADEETLHYNHKDFNLRVSEGFLNSLKLSPEELEKIKRIISYEGNSSELKIIKDADALALYADKVLYMSYIKWAHENGLDSSIKRKLDKFSKLNFEVSKAIGKAWFEDMKKDWEEYRGLK